MNKRSYINLPGNILAVAVLCTLAACGGGGGGGDGGGASPAPSPTAPPAPQQFNFTVSLDAVDIRRASNGDSVTVDPTGVSQTLTFEQ